jgi:hypothetical protein
MSITRDTRPVDPEDRAIRDKLNDLAKALRHLHSALLDEVKADYEGQHGPVGGPFALFGLVTRDPFFAWLRPLSTQMALVDELIDEKRKLLPADAAGIRAAVEALFTSTDGEPEGFAANYQARLAAAPKVAIHHTEYREAIERLPAGEETRGA